MADSKDTTHTHQVKRDGLHQHRVLNPHPHKVQDLRFQDRACTFFDPHDLLQVKYKMLRAVTHEGCSVSEAARRFGVSRPGFYQARAAFEPQGMRGLLRVRPGPKSARKLTEEVMEFIEQRVPAGQPLRARALAPEIQERFGITVHPRSIERAVLRRKKNVGRSQPPPRHEQKRSA